MINSRVFLNVRIVREKKARLNRYCLRHGLVLNDVVNAQLQPLFDAIEREEAEAGRAGGGPGGGGEADRLGLTDNDASPRSWVLPEA